MDILNLYTMYTIHPLFILCIAICGAILFLYAHNVPDATHFDAIISDRLYMYCIWRNARF